MDQKQSKRADRLLAQMVGRTCTTAPSCSPSAVLLEIAGLRTVKCELKTIQQWFADGVVESHSGNIIVTQAGQARLSRRAAQQHSFRAQHDAVTRTAGTQANAAPDSWMTDESPLARLAKLKGVAGGAYLADLELQAGEQLRRDFERGMMQPRVTASLDPSFVASGKTKSRNHGADLNDNALAARDRVSTALNKLEPDLAGVAIDVCCFLKGLETVEAERGWPRRAAKLMLKTALGGLARHYFPVARAQAVGSTGLHWATPDYRPSI